MKLPDFVYVRAFWEAFSAIVAGVLALLVMFKVLDPAWAFGYAAILAWILGILKVFKIEPQLRARAEARLLAEKAQKKAKKYK
jgi:hypothetical protein